MSKAFDNPIIKVAGIVGTALALPVVGPALAAGVGSATLAAGGTLGTAAAITSGLGAVATASTVVSGASALLGKKKSPMPEAPQIIKPPAPKPATGAGAARQAASTSQAFGRGSTLLTGGLGQGVREETTGRRRLLGVG